MTCIFLDDNERSYTPDIALMTFFSADHSTESFEAFEQ